ncbi:MAG: citryl-CoA lyase, partial [Actinobacteria bacterium]|nr:citryl-CoA lyase [Actinomycetota bacterium]
MKTSLCHADAESIEVCGSDLVEDLLGQVSFADMVGLMLFGSLPTEPHRRMIDALLIVLIEHGLVGPAIAARLTYHSAPESLQGAVAASLLSAGSRHLGTSELCAEMLQEGLAAHPDVPLPELATSLVRDRLARRDRVHGVGHGFHHGGDPRADRLLALADE